jgi:hypothetical protein
MEKSYRTLSLKGTQSHRALNCTGHSVAGHSVAGHSVAGHSVAGRSGTQSLHQFIHSLPMNKPNHEILTWYLLQKMINSDSWCIRLPPRYGVCKYQIIQTVYT